MRTNIDSVKAIIVTTLDDLALTNIIEMANRMVTTSLGTEGLDEDVLKDIETWLTAHLIAIGKERQLSQEKIGEISVKYQGTFGSFLKNTTFGQMVLMLDTSGKLSEATKRRAEIKAIPQSTDW